MSQQATERHDHAHPPTADPLGGDACCGGGGAGPADAGGTDRPAARHRYVFKVQGLDCAEEVATLRREVGPLVGGDDRLAFDVLNGRMMVLEGAERVSAEEVRQPCAGPA